MNHTIVTEPRQGHPKDWNIDVWSFLPLKIYKHATYKESDPSIWIIKVMFKNNFSVYS